MFFFKFKKNINDNLPNFSSVTPLYNTNPSSYYTCVQYIKICINSTQYNPLSHLLIYICIHAPCMYNFKLSSPLILLQNSSNLDALLKSHSNTTFLFLICKFIAIVSLSQTCSYYSCYYCLYIDLINYVV